MQLSGLHLYPVKSLRGCAVDSASVDERGLVGDRRFLVVDESNRFLTQRSHPRMALIDTALSAGRLILSAAGAGRVEVACASDPRAPLRPVTVWKSEGLLAEDCGDAAAEWLSTALGTRVRLVRSGDKFHRPMLKPGFAGTGHHFAFADGYPLLVISEASLHDLNDRIAARGDEPVPMNRFRPNLVVSGCAAFAEDTWPRFRIGEVVFLPGAPCIRCSLTTTDQLTGERGPEPLRTLATYRRDPQNPTEVKFGQNLVHETKTGRLHVGQPVELLP